MKLSTKDFLNALKMLSFSVGSKHFDSCNYLRMAWQNGKLCLATTNYECFIATELDDGSVECDQPDFIAMVSFKHLFTLMKKVDSEHVTFNNDDYSLEIVGRAKYQLPYKANIDDFLVCDLSINPDQCLNDVDVEQVELMWDDVNTAFDYRHEKYPGIQFDGSMVATNGKCLVWSNTSKGRIDPVCLPKTFGKILGFCIDDIDIGLSENGSFLVVVCNATRLIAATRLMNIEFPNYKELLDISKHKRLQVTLAREHILNAVERASCMPADIDGSYTHIALFVESDHFVIENKSCREYVEHHSWTGDDSIVFNYPCAQLIKLLKKCDDSIIDINICENGILYLETDRVQSVLMGIR